MTLHALLVNLVIMAFVAGILLDMIGLLALNRPLRQWAGRLLSVGLFLAAGAVWAGLRTAQQFPDIPVGDAALLSQHRLWGLLTAAVFAVYWLLRTLTGRRNRPGRYLRLILIVLGVLAGSFLFQTANRGFEAGRLYRKYVQKADRIPPQGKAQFRVR
ncbi:MAG: hypothetical protein D6715_02540 [Calditrichaeota bacterium]|nr:MAG: hypothetical protein D6715_02540 [Calditrichota bacterium]